MSNFQPKVYKRKIADVFGLDQSTISKIIENISNMQMHNTNKTDKREKLTKDQERTVALLAIKGEKQQDLAEKYGEDPLTE
ncbi:MAG: hypothetical protein U9O96_08315 [Candidatus Thermoplasmatota archaeon]|nr:hypothetical protein [Candidatus Thermoplasmatota archaeon]